MGRIVVGIYSQDGDMNGGVDGGFRFRNKENRSSSEESVGSDGKSEWV